MAAQEMKGSFPPPPTPFPPPLTPIIIPLTVALEQGQGQDKGQGQKEWELQAWET